ncbi:unnamed protein product [Gordionus sp. m RMFG-2023]|uniref:uncharacterized protein LOC135926093 n=1 Tax=Gordionus sp. m RMFG-2023 TaxID=3053472 RepID=UPI0030E0D18D
MGTLSSLKSDSVLTIFLYIVFTSFFIPKCDSLFADRDIDHDRNRGSNLDEEVTSINNININPEPFFPLSYHFGKEGDTAQQLELGFEEQERDDAYPDSLESYNNIDNSREYNFYSGNETGVDKHPPGKNSSNNMNSNYSNKDLKCLVHPDFEFDNESSTYGVGSNRDPNYSLHLPYPILLAPSMQVGMEACQIYANQSCCTTEQADELMLPIRKHSGIRWNLCGDMRPRCNQIMADLECFYECSPFIFSWYVDNYQDRNFQGDIRKVPICSQFCDAWYEACQNEKTCAHKGNWLKGLLPVSSSHVKNMDSKCPAGKECVRFSEIYMNGETLCGSLWGNRYKYESNNASCFDPLKPNTHEKVWKSIKNSSHSSNYKSSALIIIIICNIFLYYIGVG